MFFGEYDQTSDFFEDFYSLSYYLFDLKVMALKGFGETISQRYQILTGAKLDKNIKKEYLKSLNSKQKEFLKQRDKESTLKSKIQSVNNEIKDFFKSKGGG